MPYVPVTELSQYVGKELGHSEWLKIDQHRTIWQSRAAP